MSRYGYLYAVQSLFLEDQVLKKKTVATENKRKSRQVTVEKSNSKTGKMHNVYEWDHKTEQTKCR